MVTKDEINKVLKPWGNSVDNRPVPNPLSHNYAYSAQDRKTAYNMACRWHGDYHDAAISNDTLTDFICHQSDVIEMLANALGFANGRLDYIEERLALVKKEVCCPTCGTMVEVPK